jgi:hypothetical protein
MKTDDEKNKHKKADYIIGLEEACAYLRCSHQSLSATLKEGNDAINLYFRYYGGRFRTTYALLDSFMNSTYIIGKSHGNVVMGYNDLKAHEDNNQD